MQFRIDLICPYSRAPLRFEPAGDDFGIWRGGRVEYPHLADVPRLLNDGLRPVLVDMIRRKRAQTALHLALRPFGWRLVDRVQRRLSGVLANSPARGLLPALGRLCTGRRIARHRGTFAALLEETTDDLIGAWHLHRFSALTYLPILSLAPLLAKGARVLEIGAGMGHSAHALVRYVGARDFVALDTDFTALYLARRFFVPEATVVCADAGADLPFEDHGFDAVVMCDTFHFVPDQARLAAQVQQTLRPGGQVILSHIHNGRFSNSLSGHARTPQDYAALFAGQNPILFDNRTLLADLMAQGMVSLAPPPDVATLDSAPHLSLVTNPHGALPRQIDGIWQNNRQAGRRIVLNPLLDERRKGRPIHPRIADLIHRPAALHLQGGVQTGDELAMMRQLVLLDVPERFI